MSHLEAAEPQLLLYDEVTSSLDTSVVDAIMELLDRLGESQELSYVYGGLAVTPKPSRAFQR